MIAKLTKAQKGELEKLLAALDTAIAALTDCTEAIAEEWDDEIGAHSEKWQESGAGSDATERAEALRTFGETVRDAFDDLSLTDI